MSRIDSGNMGKMNTMVERPQTANEVLGAPPKITATKGSNSQVEVKKVLPTGKEEEELHT